MPVPHTTKLTVIPWSCLIPKCTETSPIISEELDSLHCGPVWTRAWGPVGRVVPAFPPSLLWLWQKPCWRGPSREVFRLAADTCLRCFSLGFPLPEERSQGDLPSTVHGHPLRLSPLCAADTHVAVSLVPVSPLSLQLCFSLQAFPQSGNRVSPRINALPLASDLRHSQWITVRQNSQEALASSFVRNFGWIPSKSDKIWVAGPCVTSKGLKRQQPMYCLLKNVLLF